MRISDWSSDVCSSDLRSSSPANGTGNPHGSGSPHLGIISEADTPAWRPRSTSPCSAQRPRQRDPFGHAHRFGAAGRGDVQPLARLYRADDALQALAQHLRSEEHTSEPQSLMRTTFAVFCLKNTTITI